MPRDASETRARLHGAAEQLFATRGVHQATTREINEAAGQRNASALTYHFGSRDGVLFEILIRHGDPMDHQRGELAPEPIEATSTRRLVASLLIPYASALSTQSGRYYLRIVAQLTDQFPMWRLERDLSPPHLRRILAELEARVEATPPVAAERVIGVIMLMTAAMAERARLVEDGAQVELSERDFLSTMADVTVASLEAPVGPPLEIETEGAHA